MPAVQFVIYVVLILVCCLGYDSSDLEVYIWGMHLISPFSQDSIWKHPFPPFFLTIKQSLMVLILDIDA